MDDQFGPWMKNAEADMPGHPHNGEPTGPIVAARQEHPGKNREQPDQANPYRVIFEWALNRELGRVIRQADHPSGYVDPGYNGDCKRSFFHDVRVSI